LQVTAQFVGTAPFGVNGKLVERPEDEAAWEAPPEAA
jgi:hypothetical protein